MNPLKIFKLPLSFAGTNVFTINFKKLNKNTSDEIKPNDSRIKYLIKYNNISAIETEVIISLQEDPSIVIYKFKDKLIVLPKLEKHEILYERTIMSKTNEIYIVDFLNNHILLVKKCNMNKSKGYMKPLIIDPNLKHEDLHKFIAFDLESITDLDSLKNEGDQVYFDPIMILAYDFYNKQTYKKILRKNMNEKIVENISALSRNEKELQSRSERISLLKDFFIKFLNVKYHKFTFYAHNLANYDGILLMRSLLSLCEDLGLKLEPIIRDNKLISLKIKFGRTKDNRYRWYIIFHDSLLLLLSSLEKLSNTFLKDHPELQKIQNKEILDLLLYNKNRTKEDEHAMLSDIMTYSERDSVCLASIIAIFADIIFDKYKLNIHKYPTV